MNPLWLIVVIGLALFLFAQMRDENASCPACPACPSCPACPTCPACLPCQPCNTCISRNRRVLSDPLYPPVINQDADSSFKLIGYLSNQDETWKLFGRMKDRHQGEYYIISANNNLDLKIPLTQDVVVGERLRDVYNLPQEMKFKSPMLKASPYTVTEIPKEEILR